MKRSYTLDNAIRVEIRDDYPLVKAMLTWLVEQKDVYTFRGGSTGLGNYIGWFPSEHLEDLNNFFWEWEMDHAT